MRSELSRTFPKSSSLGLEFKRSDKKFTKGKDILRTTEERERENEK